MALKFSTGIANAIADRASYRQMVTGGRHMIFSGVQPTNADSASNGTKLAVVTQSGGAFVGETLPVWTLTLSGGSGTLDSVKIGGVELLPVAVMFAVDLATTATAAAALITSNWSVCDYTATAIGAAIYISGPKNSGTSLNATVCAATSTTLGAVVSNAGLPTTQGVAVVNGLEFTFPAAAGVFSKSGSWSATGIATGTAGWFRYCCDAADDGTSSSSTYARLDGTITVAGGGGESIIDNTSITIGQLVTITSCSLGVSKG